MNTLKKIILSTNIKFILSIQIEAQDKSHNNAMNNYSNLISNDSAAFNYEYSNITIQSEDSEATGKVSTVNPRYFQPGQDLKKKNLNNKKNYYLSFGQSGMEEKNQIPLVLESINPSLLPAVLDHTRSRDWISGQVHIFYQADIL